jgi:stage II sporulation protein E
MEAAKRYGIVTGKATLAKEKGISGDTATVCNLNRGKIALFLSDGMGSGSRAASESSMAVKFLERLLNSGFSVESAVKTVNSMLLLRTPEENFATVDIVIIDSYSGETEFLKIGAAPSFIKRVHEVGTIKANSLPIGILQQIEIEPIQIHATAGDIIVLVSDGIVDALPGSNEKENWVANCLRRMPGDNPEEIAEKILAEALKLTDGYIRDDMTVLAAKIVE